MTLAPLLAAPAVVQIHAAAALTALALGVLQFVRPKGGPSHRTLGFAWLGLMTAVALSSFWITGVAGKGHWSWIHGLSGFTLVMLPLAWFAARRHKIRSHKRSMYALFFGGLVVTGLFTLLPGRIMGAVVFGW